MKMIHTCLRVITFWLLLQGLAAAQEPTPEASATPPAEAAQEVQNTSLADILSPFQPDRDDSVATVVGPMSGKKLFTIAGGEGFKAQARANVVFERLRKAAEAQGAEVTYVISTPYNGVVVLTVGSQVLVTVMPEDVDIVEPRALPLDQLKSIEMAVAESWREALQQELAYAAWTRRPEYLSVALPLLGLVWLAAMIVRSRLRKIAAKQPGAPVWSLEFMVWVVGSIITLWMFPATKGLAWALEDTILVPLVKVWLLVALAALAYHILERLIDRYFEGLLSAPDLRPRRAQRLETFRGVTCATTRVMVIIVAFGVALSLLPINFLPLLTGAGVVGVALGLAAQDFLKDIFAGVSILIEDRFGVGDWIEWNSYSGSVEMITLRATRVRTVVGGLVTIPNSELRVVNNLSNEWSQVDYRVSVAYGADLRRALRVLESVANELAEEWSERVLEKPVMKGVHSLGENGVTLRLYIKTRPLEQWDVERELNQRIKLRFDQENIEIPFPQSAVWLRNAAS